MVKKYCPICGEENNCMANDSANGNCWCNKEEFPKEILDLVPPESRRKYCICKNCLQKYKDNNLFIGNAYSISKEE